MGLNAPLRIWTNQVLPSRAGALLERELDARHTLRVSPAASRSNLDTSPPDDVLRDSDVAFGQPNPRDVIASSRLRWIHLSTAGYTIYDNDDLRRAMRARSAVLTTSSSVYAEPCAQHVLAMMLALSRQLPGAWDDQNAQTWDFLPRRARSKLLCGQSAVVVGYGAIGARLAELLSPFRMNLLGVRRTPRGDEAVPVVSFDHLNEHLPAADHVIDLLPAATSTDLFFNRDRFARMKSGANFYNVGRGTTVDQEALADALDSEHLSAAYLDVTTPEPLPAGHRLWKTRNCFITPHSAGGHEDEYDRLVRHFLANLDCFEHGKPLHDRVI